MQVPEPSWPLYVYAKQQFSMGPRIRPKKTHNLTGRRPVMTLTSSAGDNEEYCGYCPREPCACALARLVKSTYALMEHSPPEAVCLGPSSTSHSSSIQQTRQGRACDPRNDMKYPQHVASFFYVCKIVQIFVLFWKESVYMWLYVVCHYTCMYDVCVATSTKLEPTLMSEVMPLSIVYSSVQLTIRWNSARQRTCMSALC